MTIRTWRGAATALLVGLFAAAAPLAAQSAAVEQFDTAGLHYPPRTLLEQRIEAMIAQHHPGQRMQAARIQQELARLYRLEGDTARATECLDRARAGSAPNRGSGEDATPKFGEVATPTFGEDATPTFGEVATPKFGEVATPKFGEVAAPKFGEVKAPSYGQGVAVPKYGSVKAPSYGQTAAAPQYGSASAPPQPAPAARPFQGLSLAGAHATGWSGKYYVMQGITSEVTWNFFPNGTYRSERIFNNGMMSSTSGTDGLYWLGRGRITLQPVKTASAFDAGSSVGAGEQKPAPAQSYSFRMLGPRGAQGIVLGGTRLKPKTW